MSRFRCGVTERSLKMGQSKVYVNLTARHISVYHIAGTLFVDAEAHCYLANIAVDKRRRHVCVSQATGQIEAVVNRFKRAACVAIPLLGACVTVLGAETLTLSPSSVWHEWNLPSGALTLSSDGLRPFLHRKNINAGAGAIIRSVGTNSSTATRLIDGDAETGWSPNDGARLEEQWVELDLQQVLPIRRVTIHFQPDSTPLAFFKVAFSDGERFINTSNVLVDGTVRYGDSRSFSFNEAHSVTIDLDEEPIRVLRLEAQRLGETAIISEIEIEAIGDNVGFDLIERGGSVGVVAEIVALAGNPSVMFDGDMATAWRVNPLAKGSSGGGETFGDYRIDLGAKYRIDGIKLFGDPIAIQPRSRHFYANFLSYQILFSDGSLAPDGSLEWQVLAAILGDQRNLLDVRNFEHSFDPVGARYLRLFYPTSINGGIIGGGIDGTSLRLDGLGFVAEFQIFGEGYPERVALRSPVIDLGADWNVNSLSWGGDTPVGSQILFRSRTGDAVLEETHYYDNKGKEVTERRYNKLIKSFRGPIETAISPGAGWSAWSEEYLEPGMPFRSPSPRRYVQLKAELLSEETFSAATLGPIVLEFDRPLATTAFGEIVPQEVDPGMIQSFSYFLLPTFSRQNFGFDQILMKSTVPMLFESLLLDGVMVSNVEHEDTDGGFRLHLPEIVDTADLLEVRFDATVFQRTRFHGILENEGGDIDLRQAVDPGDAADGVEGDSDIVSLPVDGDIFANLTVSSSVFSPNGDGIRDEVVVSFDALKLTSARPIVVLVYDLQGRLLHRTEQTGIAGHYDIGWDGLDNSGRLVVPGLYVLRVEIVGDARTGSATRVVGLVY